MSYVAVIMSFYLVNSVEVKFQVVLMTMKSHVSQSPLFNVI